MEVHAADGVVAVGGPRLRGLLALLALDAGRIVSIERLVDGLYGAEAPGDVANALQSQFSRLRRRGIERGRGVLARRLPAPPHLPRKSAPSRHPLGRGGMPAGLTSFVSREDELEQVGKIVVGD